MFIVFLCKGVTFNIYLSINLYTNEPTERPTAAVSVEYS